MRNMMFSGTTVIWICIIAAVLAVIIVLGFVIKSKQQNEDNNDFSGDDNIHNDEQYNTDNPETENAVSDKIIENKTNIIESDNIKEKVPAETDYEYADSTQENESYENDIETLYENKNGRIEMTNSEEGFKIRLVEDGKVMGESNVYQTKLGLLKGLKSLVNYKDTVVCDNGEEDTTSSRFEVFMDDDGNYGYNLKSKIKTKFTGSGFETRKDCDRAINAVKNIGTNFTL